MDAKTRAQIERQGLTRPPFSNENHGRLVALLFTEDLAATGHRNGHYTPREGITRADVVETRAGHGICPDCRMRSLCGPGLRCSICGWKPWREPGIPRPLIEAFSETLPLLADHIQLQVDAWAAGERPEHPLWDSTAQKPVGLRGAIAEECAAILRREGVAARVADPESRQRGVLVDVGYDDSLLLLDVRNDYFTHYTEFWVSRTEVERSWRLRQVERFCFRCFDAGRTGTAESLQAFRTRNPLIPTTGA